MDQGYRNIALVQGLERLLETEWRGMPESAVLEKLQAEAARHPDEIIVKKEAEVIWFEETRFNFEHGKLKSVGAPITGI